MNFRCCGYHHYGEYLDYIKLLVAAVTQTAPRPFCSAPAAAGRRRMHAAYCSFSAVENKNLFQSLLNQSECFLFNTGLFFVWLALFVIGVTGIICFRKSFLKADRLSKETVVLTKAENITADYYFTYFSLFGVVHCKCSRKFPKNLLN